MAANNTLCHFEIPSTDFARSKDFYEALFGWRVQILTEMNYAIFDAEDGIGGGFNLMEKFSNDGIQAYIQVDDIPATLARAEELGGKVLKPKTEIGESNGYYAFFKDICGAQIGLWSQD